MLTQSELKAVLTYDPEAGIFRWARNTHSCWAGKLAGTKSAPGEYKRIRINRIEYKAHRLAWLYMTGEWPKLHIDHINGEPSDNRFVNLREATHTQNMANQRKGNRGSARGTGRLKRSFRAYVAGEHLGCFPTQEAASQAYAEAASQRFGEYDWQKSEGLPVVIPPASERRTHCARGHELSGDNLGSGGSCRHCRRDDMRRLREMRAAEEGRTIEPRHYRRKTA